MKKIRRPVTLAFLIFTLAACNLPRDVPGTSDAGGLATRVAATLQAMTPSATETPPASETPSEPTFTLEPTPTMTVTLTPVPKPGTIEGTISGYPYGSIPRLAIVAFGQEPPYNYSYWITASGSTFFSMTSSYLIPGKYQVVAYDSSGHAGGCPTIVTVVSEQKVTCNITSWGGSWPSKPGGVPSP